MKLINYLLAISVCAGLLFACGGGDDENASEKDYLYYKTNQITNYEGSEDKTTITKPEGLLGYIRLHKINANKIELTAITGAFKTPELAENIDNLQLVTNGKPFIIVKDEEGWTWQREDGKKHRKHVQFKWGEEIIELNFKDEFDNDEDNIVLQREDKIKTNQQLLVEVKKFFTANKDYIEVCAEEEANDSGKCNQEWPIITEEMLKSDKLKQYGIKYID